MGKYFQPEIECASREDLLTLQNERLRTTVRRVYDNVKMYRNRMDEAGVKPEDINTVEDLHKLPFVTKQDLRDTYPFGMVAAPMSEVVEIHATSGTTGKQVVACYTQHDIDLWGDCCARAIVAAGGSRDDHVHISYGYGLFTGGLGLDHGSHRLGAVTFPVSSGNTQRQIQIMQDMGSTILCCTPSYAAYLGETIQELGIKDSLKLKSGILGAEPWSEEMRRDIQDKLGIKAYDIYGLTEVIGPGVAFECEEQSGMHVNEDHFIIEIIDPDTGMPLPDGQIGELVFTAITKEAFPLLRYRTRDLCYTSHEKCSCGRTLVKMAKPMGRTDDMLIIRGVNVFPSQIETVLLNRGFSPNYQLIIDRVSNIDTLEVRVEMNAEMFSDTIKHIEKHEKELVNDLKSMLGILAKVTLVAPKSIERSEGKAKRVIDKRKI